MVSSQARREQVALACEHGLSKRRAWELIEIWRRHYNHVRPHQSLKDLTPIEFKTRYDSTNPGAILK